MTIEGMEYYTSHSRLSCRQPVYMSLESPYSQHIIDISRGLLDVPER